MKVADLAALLAKSNIPPDSYCLTGGLPNECYCLEQLTNGKWQVYYSERGLRTGPMEFETEGEACDYFCRNFMA